MAVLLAVPLNLQWVLIFLPKCVSGVLVEKSTSNEYYKYYISTKRDKNAKLEIFNIQRDNY